jgi:hypothetical protein
MEHIYEAIALLNKTDAQTDRQTYSGKQETENKEIFSSLLPVHW